MLTSQHVLPKHCKQWDETNNLDRCEQRIRVDVDALMLSPNSVALGGQFPCGKDSAIGEGSHAPTPKYGLA